MRTLVDRALEKASKAEFEGNKERAEKFLKIAEQAEQVYDRIEKKIKGQYDIY